MVRGRKIAGEVHGYGKVVYRYSNGDHAEYEGQFRYGMQHGKGTLTNGHLTYTVRWCESFRYLFHCDSLLLLLLCLIAYYHGRDNGTTTSDMVKAKKLERTEHHWRVTSNLIGLMERYYLFAVCGISLMCLYFKVIDKDQHDIYVGRFKDGRRHGFGQLFDRTDHGYLGKVRYSHGQLEWHDSDVERLAYGLELPCV